MAARTARHGIASTVAMVHLARAQSLGLPKSDAALSSALDVALATRTATPRPALRLRITCEKSIDPQLELMIASAMRVVFTGSDNALSNLSPHALRADQETVTVHILNAELIGDFKSLETISSSYLSHYQRVPNPRKRALELDCNMAEISVNFAESGLDSAIANHNIYPTQWSLMNVNMARNNYVRAIDDYNFKAQLYNSTPSTIEEPVFMPYSFRQGTVRFGWRLAAQVSAPEGAPVECERESVATDFVRLGSKVTDKTESYRRSDALDIDISPDAGLNHLFKAVREVRDSINLRLGKLPFATTATLAPDQRSLLAWLHHPLGIQKDLAEKLGVPDWAARSSVPEELLREVHDPAPPETLVVRCEPMSQATLTPETAAALLAPLVCQTRASGDGAGSTGTGTLIGPEGLILTCAHALTGPSLRVHFPTGTWQGTHEAEVVFVNAKRDVAVIRARGLKNDRWANVRLDQPSTAGESIVSIGNSAMSVGGINMGGVVAGIVSNPLLERNDSRYLSADISIASGSSGGPLFSLKDGSLVGVVQLVATTPGINQDQEAVSSTGFLALAAPANLLGDWLGLRTTQLK